ncbi:MAG: hypothetical protein IT373_34835, partial [Polyangiaceae bacterium]|nr:hypothetical protein [Polyangiaceae bacterium]
MSHSPTMIGRLGQHFLGVWAAQAAITANPSIFDEKGWDALLQFRQPGAPLGGPLDLAPPEMTCMVQVKATLAAEMQEPLSLTNWRRMATDPMPWFILSIHLDPERQEPVDAYLVHVDEHWCAKVFRRLRELGKLPVPELAKRTMTASWSDSDRIDLHGTALRSRICGHIKMGQREYVAEKLRWFTDLGYENRARGVTITMRVPDLSALHDHLSDLAIGVRDTFPAGWMASVWDTRFGMRGELETFDARAGEVRYHPPAVGRVALQLKSAVRAPVALADCGLYRATAVFPFLPPEYDRVRLVHDACSVVLAPFRDDRGRGFGASFAVSIPSGLVSVNVLRERVALTLMLCDAANPVSITLSTSAGDWTITPTRTEAKNGDQETVLALEAALAVCDSFAVPTGTLVDTGHLINQATSARFMAAALSKESGTLTSPYLESVAVGTTFGVVSDAVLHLPDRTLYMAIGAFGDVTDCVAVPGLGAGITVSNGTILHRAAVIDASTADPERLAEVERNELVTTLRSRRCATICDR